VARTIRPEMKVLFLSGYTDDAAVRRDVREGEFALLQKPITPTRLAQKVREVLDRGRDGDGNVGCVRRLEGGAQHDDAVARARAGP